jgi:hypothetical protein
MVMACPDVVGCGGAGVYVSLNTGSGFSAMTQWVVAFGKGIGWTDNNTYPNMLIDVNGDSLPDVVGFAASGVYVGIDLDGNRTSRLGRTIAYTSYNKPSSITRHAHHLLPRRDRASALQADHAGKDHALHRRVRRSGRGQQSRHGLHALDRLSAKVGMRALRVASETLTTRYFITDYLGLVSVPSNLQFTCNVLIWIPASAPIFTSKLLKLRIKKETLNQRVPGSSPGAPTKLFRDLPGSLPHRTRTVLQAILQFCSRFELQYSCFSELDIAAKIVCIENGLDVSQAVTSERRDLRHRGAGDGHRTTAVPLRSWKLRSSMPARSESLPHDDVNPSAVHGRCRELVRITGPFRSVMSSSVLSGGRYAANVF